MCIHQSWPEDIFILGTYFSVFSKMEALFDICALIQSYKSNCESVQKLHSVP